MYAGISGSKPPQPLYRQQPTQYAGSNASSMDAKAKRRLSSRGKSMLQNVYV